MSSTDQEVRVCHVISSFRPVIGGAERATETLTDALAAEGVDVVVATRRYEASAARRERIGRVSVRRLGAPGRSKRNALSFAVACFLAIATDLRGYRLLHVQNIDTPMLVGLLARVFLRKRLVATIHGESPILAARTTTLGRIRVGLMSRFVHAFTAINPEVTRLLREEGVPADRIRSIPNGIDTSVFCPPTEAERQAARQAVRIGSNEHVVLYQGRLVPFKRIDLLLDAWARLGPTPDWRLVVVGQGPEAARLEQHARDLGIEARFDGPTDAPWEYLRASDVFVLPSGDETSQDYEGLSVALLEAMATGLTVIVSDVPGNAVLVDGERTGLSFPMGDADALADRLRHAMGSAESRERLGREAHERVSREYAAKAVARDVKALYETVLGL